MGKPLQTNSVPVRLLHRRTVIPPHYDTGITLSEHLARKSGAFQSELVRIDLSEDLFVDLDANGPFSKGKIFVGLGLGKAISLDFFSVHNQRFFLTDVLDEGFFVATLGAGFFTALLLFTGALGGGAVGLP